MPTYGEFAGVDVIIGPALMPLQPWGCAKEGICETTSTVNCCHVELVPLSCWYDGCWLPKPGMECSHSVPWMDDATWADLGVAVRGIAGMPSE